MKIFIALLLLVLLGAAVPLHALPAVALTATGPSSTRVFNEALERDLHTIVAFVDKYDTLFEASLVSSRNNNNNNNVIGLLHNISIAIHNVAKMIEQNIPQQQGTQRQGIVKAAPDSWTPLSPKPHLQAHLNKILTSPTPAPKKTKTSAASDPAVQEELRKRGQDYKAAEKIKQYSQNIQVKATGLLDAIENNDPSEVMAYERSLSTNLAQAEVLANSIQGTSKK
eukprot:Nk52_evm13s278 gene=Nk52_evmTU13s278